VITKHYRHKSKLLTRQTARIICLLTGMVYTELGWQSGAATDKSTNVTLRVVSGIKLFQAVTHGATLRCNT